MGSEKQSVTQMSRVPATEREWAEIPIDTDMHVPMFNADVHHKSKSSIMSQLTNESSLAIYLIQAGYLPADP